MRQHRAHTETGWALYHLVLIHVHEACALEHCTKIIEHVLKQHKQVFLKDQRQEMRISGAWDEKF